MRQIKKRLYTTSVIFCLFCCLFLLSCTSKPAETESRDSNPNTKPAVDMAIDLKIIVINNPQLAGELNRQSGHWRALTGGKLIVEDQTKEQFDQSELRASPKTDLEVSSGQESLSDPVILKRAPRAYSKTDASNNSDTSTNAVCNFDIIIYPVSELGYLVENDIIAPYARKNETYDNDFFELLVQRQCTWNGRTMAVPLGCPLLMLYYRADIFQKLDLRPPETWQQYSMIAQKLQHIDPKRYPQLANEPNWSGAVEPVANGWAAKTLIARAAAYAKHPNHFAVLFDRDDLKPRINSVAFVRALDEMQKIYQLNPDLNRGLTASRNAVYQGHAAMAISWPSPDRSKIDSAGSINIDSVADRSISENIHITSLPGSRQVFNPSSNEWEDRYQGDDRRVSVLGFNGQLGSLLRSSSNQVQAKIFLNWLSGREFSSQILSETKNSAPFRKSHRGSIRRFVEPGLSSQQATGYFSHLQNGIRREGSLGALRIPGADRYMTILNQQVLAVLQNKKTAAEGLRVAADRWQKLTDQLGRERQKKAYRYSLGL